MSAEAFRRALNRVPELKQWASGQRDTSSILHQTRESSKGEVRRSSVDQVIPLEQLSSILNEGTAKAIFAEIKTGKYITGFEDVIYQNVAGQETIVFKGLNFDNLNKSVAGYLQNIAADASVTGAENISETILSTIKERKYDKGHVFGWANTLVQRTKGSIGEALTANSRDIPPEQLKKELEALDDFIDNLLDILEEYDAATSNLKGLTSSVYAKYRKTDSNWLIEWQANKEQQAAGGRVGTALGKSSDKGVKGFLKQVGYGSGDNLIEKALHDMVDGFIKQGLAKEGSESLVNLESSPPIIALLEDSLVSAITGKKKKYKDVYTGAIDNIVELTIRKVQGQEKLKSDIRKAKSDLKQLKAKTNATKSKIVSTAARPREVSLTGLQNLINGHLQDVLSANMGSGQRKDILNYRTGRFAGSAKVEHMTLSREGMITAFYSYMKNPYATFSQGGRQSIPTSRDPKLLISKSIREIATEKVANRLRAVSV